MARSRTIRGRGIFALGDSPMNVRQQTKTTTVPNAVEVKPGVYVANSSTSVFVVRTSPTKK
jgi:hypothetical protein